jgi:hypothetical protein
MKESSSLFSITIAVKVLPVTMAIVLFQNINW